MREARTFSLRANFLMLLVGTTLPVLLIAGLLVSRVVADNRDEVSRRLLEASRAGAAVVDAELAGTIRALQGLSESDRLTNGELPEFRQQARRLLTTQPIWSAVSLSTLDHLQVLNTGRPLGQPLPEVTDRDSFDRALRTKAPAVGNLHVGAITKQLGFLVRVPAIRDGRVVYVLSAWLTSSGFATVLRGQAKLSDEWVRGIVDADGTVVARSRDANRFVGQKGTLRFLEQYDTTDEGIYRDVSLDGTAVYGAFSRAPMSRWIAGVAVPAPVVDASFRQSLIALAAMTVLLLSIGGGGAYLLSRRIARDISQTATDADAMARGVPPSPPRSQVTELRRLQEGLARSAVLLETHQRERDEQVARADAARAEAEAADRTKDEFLALLGHELRNPLAPALTAVHLMKLRADSTRERDIIERQIRHMARLVDDLLDVSRLRRGDIELRRERFELGDAVARAIEMTAPIFAEKQHDLQVDVAPGLTVDGDRIRIAQVLSNLLSNAAKYTEPGGRITLGAYEEHGELVIECRDNGIGIAVELLPHVFDLFVQGQRGLDRRQGGLGLGLAVARMLVERHGGTIEAASVGRGEGSAFVIRLPSAMPVASTSSVDDRGVVRTSHAPVGCVMVVDDNLDALEMVIEALKEGGIEAFGAASAREALDLALQIHPDIAVLDIGLPDMNGFELARALRSLPGGALLRLVALTGYGREQDKGAARAAGFDAFFAKPADIPALLDALHRLSAADQT
jgi:signal transduction histidine kinase/CheY-like chemotaxis protein